MGKPAAPEKDLHMWKTYVRLRFIKDMTETIQIDQDTNSELLSERWSVVSFDKCEASGLTYAVAIQRMAELDKRRIAGLCIVTDEAAARITV